MTTLAPHERRAIETDIQKFLQRRQSSKPTPLASLADPEIQSKLANILASDSDYLESLFSITGSSEFMGTLGKSNNLTLILPSVTVEHWSQFLESIKEKKTKEAETLKGLITEQIATLKTSTTRHAPAPSSAAAVNLPPPAVAVDTKRLLDGRQQFDINHMKVALFNVAPLGDCGLLSLPGNITRQEARRLVEQAINTPGKLHPDDVAYLKDQHHHLTTEGQSLQQRHLKLIGYLLGYNVSFYSDLGGMLIEDSEIKIATKPTARLHPVYIYDGEGHFQALIPVNDPVALQQARDKEKQGQKQTAAYARRYQ